MKKLFLSLLVFGVFCMNPVYAEGKQLTIADTVIVKEVAEGVTAQDVIDAMLSKATELNMKYVGSLALYKELRNRGLESGHLEIFQFCTPSDARKMVDVDMTFSAYLPCRITMIEKDKKLYLTMMDLNLLINMANLDETILGIAYEVRDALNAIIEAGATGEF